MTSGVLLKDATGKILRSVANSDFDYQTFRDGFDKDHEPVKPYSLIWPLSERG